MEEKKSPDPTRYRIPLLIIAERSFRINVADRFKKFRGGVPWLPGVRVKISARSELKVSITGLYILQNIPSKGEK